MLPKQGYWKSFIIIIYLKIKSHTQFKSHNVSIPVAHLIQVITEMIKSLRFIYNKGLISYSKILFEIKNNP